MQTKTMTAFSKILSLFSPQKMKKWRNFRTVSSDFLDFTKSVIISADITEDGMILPARATSIERFVFFCFLVSFFSVKADVDLENYGVPKEFRDDFIENMQNFILAEYNIYDRPQKNAKKMIYTYMNESAIVAAYSDKLDIEMVSKTALKFISSFIEKSGEKSELGQEGDIEFMNKRFTKAIDYYNSFSGEYLADIGKLF